MVFLNLKYKGCLGFPRCISKVAEAATESRNADPEEIFKVISYSWERALGVWLKALQQRSQAISVKEQQEDQKLHLALDVY